MNKNGNDFKKIHITFFKYMVVQQLGGGRGNVVSFVLYVVIFNSSCVIIAAFKTDDIIVEKNYNNHIFSSVLCKSIYCLFFM